MKILLVDDEKNILDSVGKALRRSGHEVVTAGNFHAGLSLCDSAVQVALLDVWLPDGDGIDLLKNLRQKFPNLAIVMISGHSSIATAVEAVKHGAYDFLEKPLSLDRLEVTLQNIQQLVALRNQRDELLDQLDSDYRLIGESDIIGRLRQQIIKFAIEDSPVLITGESGTGKELVARMLHKSSLRKDSPFVAVNCAALPGELAEAELFGYERGAFTGAVHAHPGHFRRAEDGVIFLDEISEASAALQAKLLRVIENKKVVPLSGQAEYSIKARIITASNKNLDREVEAGRFRQDLFFRLNVLPIRVPSLRERSGDIRLLVDHFCRMYAARSNKKIRKFAPSAIAYLEGLSYPGNIRELKNYVERILIMCETDPIEAEQIKSILTNPPADTARPGSSLKQAVEDFEKRYILETIAGAQSNMALAARALGIERSHLYKKMKALGIDRPREAD